MHPECHAKIPVMEWAQGCMVTHMIRHQLQNLRICLSLHLSVCLGVCLFGVCVCLSVILYKLQSSLETLHSLAGICSPAAFNRVQTWHARQ